MAGYSGEGSEQQFGSGLGYNAEEDAVERDRTDDKERTNLPHQEFREACFS